MSGLSPMEGSGGLPRNNFPQTIGQAVENTVEKTAVFNSSEPAEVENRAANTTENGIINEMAKTLGVAPNEVQKTVQEYIKTAQSAGTLTKMNDSFSKLAELLKYTDTDLQKVNVNKVDIENTYTELKNKINNEVEKETKLSQEDITFVKGMLNGNMIPNVKETLAKCTVESLKEKYAKLKPFAGNVEVLKAIGVSENNFNEVFTTIKERLDISNEE